LRAIEDAEKSPPLRTPRTLRLTLVGIVVHNPSNTVTQVGDIEVDQQADTVTTESEIGHHLCVVERVQFFHGLQFDDDAVFDEEIDPVSRIDPDVAVADWKSYLMFESQSIHTKLVSEAGVIRAFEAAGSNDSVNLEPGSDDAFRKRVVCHHESPLSVLCVLSGGEVEVSDMQPPVL
jgi:hypothetical protein